MNLTLHYRNPRRW